MDSYGGTLTNPEKKLLLFWGWMKMPIDLVADMRANLHWGTSDHVGMCAETGSKDPHWHEWYCQHYHYY